ncbi:hypothetical protein HPB48_022015 [Haemaphysalis longicornis]|uniref:Uncharacterized protein n=1 Tax=Haemaphysalis longicornis TaxID=44386 RepID=A0A9J6GAP9_HAELO|nr:hypothetical protein HPB48_022015 [Haemaphysalis longicornis]
MSSQIGRESGTGLTVLDLPFKTYVVDVAIPWDNSIEAAEHANQEKRRKYNPIIHVMSKPTKVLGLAFGARGLVCPSTRRAAKEIGLRDSDVAWLATRALVGSLICLNRFSKIVWKDEQSHLLKEAQGQPVTLAGDGRADSPSYCAKYSMYSLPDLENKLLPFEVVQECRTEISCSNLSYCYYLLYNLYS